METNALFKVTAQMTAVVANVAMIEVLFSEVATEETKDGRCS